MDTLGPAVNPFEDPPQTQGSAFNPKPLLTEHAFHLIGTDGHRWLTLKLRSSAATASVVPYFFGGDVISGKVELDLHDAATLREIIVTISGRLSWNSSSRSVFLNLTQSVWQAKESEQRASPRFLRTLRQPGQALSGQHSFPFTFELPEHIVLPDSHENAPPALLPASVDEHGARYAVEYSISVQLRRAGLSADSWILEPILYCPSVQPEPFPEPRREAYERGDGVLPGPDTVPNAWQMLPPVEVSGTLRDGRSVSVTYQLSLAKPLVYTRGTPLPLSLLISSTDTQALDVFASTSSPNVKLLCNSYTLATKNRYTVTDRDVRDIQNAVWSPAQPDATSRAIPSRRLVGEIHLPTSLKPGARFPNWKLFYAVALYVPNVPDFVFTMTGKRSEAPMAMVEVGLASLHARGMPRPVAASAVSHSPPGPWRREVDLKQGWTVLMGAGYDGRHLSFQ